MNTSARKTPEVSEFLSARDLQRLPATVYRFRIEPNGTPWFPYVSKACAEIYGFAPHEAMADVGLMHDAVHPADRSRFDDAGQRSLRTLEPLKWQGRIVRPDGGERTVFIASRPKRRHDGGTEWVGVVTEIPTAQHASDPIEADTVSDVHADALAMLGHDLAGPLTTIMASVEWALEDLEASVGWDAGDPRRDTMRRRLETIVRQTHRISDLRDDLLAVAAADADTIRAEPVTVEVLPYLRAAADLDGTGLKLVVDCPADLLAVVQPSHLSRMLANLVANAVRYARTQVTLSAWLARGRVLIAVRDDGEGVPAEVAARLFRRFSHAGVQARPVGAGTGLGLYIVRTLATANQGTVLYAAGEPGATFTIALPAARTE